MNEKETSAYIEELKKYGSVPGLTNIRNLCEKLGHPERELSFEREGVYAFFSFRSPEMCRI